MPLASQTRSGFLDSILDLLPRIESRRIRSADDYSEVFKLRYRAYVAHDLIELNEGGVSIDRYDLLENCQLFGLYLDGDLVSSLRIHRVRSDTPWCPAIKSFPEYLIPRLEDGESFVDGSRFCVDPGRSSELSVLPFLTVRLAYMASIHFDSTYNISVVRREHAAFYRRYFGFERWAGDVKLDWYKLPVDLYVGDMRTNRARIDERLPFMKSNFEERLMLFSDELPAQGIRRVTGLHGNIATNSPVDPAVGQRLTSLLASGTGG
jgi:N-acyl-L-homoserine lactone synthetase|nr:hypothetical protein [Neorhizobium tomejilense]